ncbi:jg16793 [Pararge aegeria aegeria]|uniref:Jg16793 protein n=1 Tax=Pararge aegeria aegeria TaxID=348720 RepID=A0A8S4QS17_9NEOP|nr:jg16793 [Pararge aegeria aegeria]
MWIGIGITVSLASTATETNVRKSACQRVLHSVLKAWSLSGITLMRRRKQPQPLVPGGPAIPGSGSDYGNSGARDVKNLQQRFRCQPRRLDLATKDGRWGSKVLEWQPRTVPPSTFYHRTLRHRKDLQPYVVDIPWTRTRRFAFELDSEIRKFVSDSNRKDLECPFSFHFPQYLQYEYLQIKSE